MHPSYDEDTEVQNTKKSAQGQTTRKRGGAIWAGKGTEEQKVRGLRVKTSRSIDRESGRRLSCGREAGGCCPHITMPISALTMRSGGGVLPMKHSTLPPSPLTAYCTASLEIMGGPASRRGSQGQLEPTVPVYPSPAPQATHRSHKVAPPAQPLQFVARWPGRCRCRHLPGSPTSTAAGCCCSGPGQREEPRVGSQEAWAPRSVWAPYEKHWKESRKGQ